MHEVSISPCNTVSGRCYLLSSFTDEDTGLREELSPGDRRLQKAEPGPKPTRYELEAPTRIHQAG